MIILFHTRDIRKIQPALSSFTPCQSSALDAAAVVAILPLHILDGLERGHRKNLAPFSLSDCGLSLPGLLALWHACQRASVGVGGTGHFGYSGATSYCVKALLRKCKWERREQGERKLWDNR